MTMIPLHQDMQKLVPSSLGVSMQLFVSMRTIHIHGKHTHLDCKNRLAVKVSDSYVHHHLSGRCSSHRALILSTFPKACFIFLTACCNFQPIAHSWSAQNKLSSVPCSSRNENFSCQGSCEHPDLQCLSIPVSNWWIVEYPEARVPAFSSEPFFGSLGRLTGS